MKSFTQGKKFSQNRRGGDRFEGKKSFGGKKPWEGGGRSFGTDRDRGEMFAAVCGACGASCEVPFRPKGDKPVLCNACFGKGDAPRFDRPRQSYGDRGQRDTFRSFDKPRRESAPASQGNLEKSISLLASKLDTVIGLLERQASAVVSDVSKKAPDTIARGAKKKTVVKTTKKVTPKTAKKKTVAKTAKKASKKNNKK